MVRFTGDLYDSDADGDAAPDQLTPAESLIGRHDEQDKLEEEVRERFGERAFVTLQAVHWNGRIVDRWQVCLCLGQARTLRGAIDQAIQAEQS